MKPSFMPGPGFDIVDEAENMPGDGHAEAVAELRAAFARCEQRNIDNATMNAVLIAELLPRLVEAYGPLGVAGVLGRLASQIADTHFGKSQTRQ